MRAGEKVVSMFNKATKNMSIYAKIAYGILVSMAVLIPFAVGSRYVPIPVMYSQFTLFKASALLILTSAVLVFWALDFFLGAKKLRWHNIMWVALAYLVTNIISYFVSIDKRMSFMGDYDRLNGLIPTLVLVVLFFLTVQLIRNNAGMQFFMQVFVLVSVALACYGLIQSAGLDPVYFSSSNVDTHRSSSFYGNSNLYAGYLCFSIFFSAGLLFIEKKAAWRAIYWVALLANLAVALTSMSRSVWLACIICIPLYMVFMWRQKAVLTRGDKYAFGVGALAGVALISVTLTNKAADLNVAKRLAGIFSLEGSAGTRVEMWKSAIAITKEYPLFGAGPDTFSLTGMSHLTTRYLDLVGLGEVPSNAHNLPLHLAATTGIFGLLSYYAVAVYALVISLKFAWENKEPKASNAKLMYAAVLTAVVAFSINCVVSVADIGVLPFYWIALAYLVVPKTQDIECENLIVQVLPLVFALPFALMCFVLPIKFLVADHNFRLAQDVEQASPEQIALYQKAVKLNPYESDYATKLLDSIGGSYIARLDMLTIADAENLLATIDRYYEEHPYQFDAQSVASYYYTAIAVAIKSPDLYERAIQNNVAILRKTPHQLKVLGDLGSLYKATGQIDKADEIYSFIKKTGPDTDLKQELLELIDSVKTNTK